MAKKIKGRIKHRRDHVGWDDAPGFRFAIRDPSSKVDLQLYVPVDHPLASKKAGDRIVIVTDD